MSSPITVKIDLDGTEAMASRRPYGLNAGAPARPDGSIEMGQQKGTATVTVANGGSRELRSVPGAKMRKIR
ncbi:MAG TPA: hypothetical protein VMH36_00505 [Alphaproteobacteria bacterium]|nr:hypothetical protein [Alphaproteobacteria bacterium]